MTQTFSSETANAFARVRFIMVRPSHPGNVGAAARAIKTMGFHDLCLVAPRFPDVLDLPEAQSLASGATDVLAAVTIVPTLHEALAPVTMAFALTARARMIGPPPCDIRVAADISCNHLRQSNNKVAIVLGTERSGLTNDDIALCQRICHIPANPDYSSLNVAQALQLAAWELRYALVVAATLPLLPVTDGQAEAGSEPATSGKIQALMTHWEQAMVAVGFLDPEHPKKLMPRMRHLFGRNALSQDEVDMLRGLCTAMIKTARKQ
ncbi:RNA methyltransferase [Pollutimonas nitritireducens]|uniref:tRNA (cytidine/uridine-2'-O-)-methyltransferase TrmJ n=1 Tax=Pollutimonas nitritireducens TaxID=2045209 RepID=A0A2N4UJQ6_9BURK|nr:RNA methyltransferase [Pollutimonas nitritireducens]PLC55256.1 RNA methyltransferase [Pollutimonas nitritireducens]